MIKRYIKQLGKDSLVYGLGGIVARSIGFFLLPVYTRIFSPADYGAITLLTLISTSIGILIELRMNGSQSYYFFHNKSDGQSAKSKVVTAILQWRIIWGACIVLLAMLLSPLISNLLFSTQLSWEYFAIAFSGILFFQIANQSAQVFRLLYRPGRYLSIMLGQTLLSATIALVLIIGLNMGIKGFFIGSLAGSIFAGCWGWWQLRDYLDWSQWHTELWPKLIKFGAPLVPDTLSLYLLNTADRWFISHYHGQEALGLYAVGAKFALVIAMAVSTFRRAWWPIALNAVHEKDGPLLFRNITRFYMGVGSASIIILTAMSPHLVRWFTTPAYFNAYPIIGILAWHSIFYGFYLIVSIGIWKAEKTYIAPILSGASAFLNILLNAWLVPKYGSTGAALTTSISFCVWVIITMFVSEKLWRVGYDYMRMGMQVCVGAIACYLILQIYSCNVSLWYLWLIMLIAVPICLCLSVNWNHIGIIIRGIKEIYFET